MPILRFRSVSEPGTFLVNGKLCNGGPSRQFGWGRFDLQGGDVNGETCFKHATKAAVLFLTLAGL